MIEESFLIIFLIFSLSTTQEIIMKHYLMSIGLLFILVNFIAASGIDGKWKGTFQGPNGPFDIIYTFKVTDDSLTGNVQTPMGTKDFFNGKIDSTRFSFDTEWNAMTMYHHCTVKGDSILMKMPGMNGDETQVTLKRAE